MQNPTYNSNVFDASQIAQGSTIPERWSHGNPVAQTIRHLWIPNTISSIGNLAFARCPNLETVEFEEGGQSLNLGMSVFFDCQGLVRVHLPSHIRFIDRGCFRWCLRLEDFTISDGCPQLQILDSLVTVFEGCPKAEEFQKVLRRAAARHSAKHTHAKPRKSPKGLPLLEDLRAVMPVERFDEKRIGVSVSALFDMVKDTVMFDLDNAARNIEDAWKSFDEKWNNPDCAWDFFSGRAADSIAGAGMAHVGIPKNFRYRIKEIAPDLITLYGEIRSSNDNVDLETLSDRYFQILGLPVRNYVFFHRTIAILRPDVVAPWANAPSMGNLYAWLHGDEVQTGEFYQKNWFRMSKSVHEKMEQWIPNATRGQRGIFVHRLAEAFCGTLAADKATHFRDVLTKNGLLDD